MKNFQYKKEEGYAILFTVVVVSAISVITAGLSNAVYKQLVLSSLAKDSQIAFYQSDTATDCALYADRIVRERDPTFGSVDSTWSCGGIPTLRVVNLDGDSYGIHPTLSNETSTNPCFRIDVIKSSPNPPVVVTNISAKGYNICNKTNIRTVEREIKITYEE